MQKTVANDLTKVERSWDEAVDLIEPLSSDLQGFDGQFKKCLYVRRAQEVSRGVVLSDFAARSHRIPLLGLASGWLWQCSSFCVPLGGAKESVNRFILELLDN